MSLILDLQVDMDMEDDDSFGVPSTLEEKNIEKFTVPPQEDIPACGMSWICPKGHLYFSCCSCIVSLVVCPKF